MRPLQLSGPLHLTYSLSRGSQPSSLVHFHCLNHAISSDTFLCADASNHLTFGCHTTLQGLFISSQPYDDFFLQFRFLPNFLSVSILYLQRNISATMKNLRYSPLLVRIRSQFCGLPAPSATNSFLWIHQTTTLPKPALLPLTLCPFLLEGSSVQNQQLSWVWPKVHSAPPCLLTHF